MAVHLGQAAACHGRPVRVAGALGVLAMLSACNAFFPPETTPKLAAFQSDANIQRQLLANIDLSSGLSYSDASSIANYYLAYRAGNRGRLMALIDNGQRYDGQVQSTADGTTIPGYMRIDKATGGVSWGLGPTVRNLKELLGQ